MAPHTPDARRERPELRIALHYAASFVTLAVYGGQVCPFIEGMSVSTWLGVLLSFYMVMSAARLMLMGRFVSGAPYARRSKAQFMVELAIFVVSGTALALFNLLAFQFPLSSGVKVFAGFAVLGTFVAMDMALMRERRNAREVHAQGLVLVDEGRFFSLTRKFAFASTSIVVSLVLVIFLVLIKDMDWIVTLAPEEIERGRMAVLGELAFIGGVIIAYLANLIASYARNLRMYFTSQNAALEGVAGGRLDAAVPVSTHDEFGVMARYTNQMIHELAERTREIETTQDVTILTLASVAEIRDNETGRHILRTQRYVRALAEHLRADAEFSHALDARTVEMLFKSAPLHDIGKVGVRDAVLRKPGPLTDEEWAEMREHPRYGRDALQSAQALLGSNYFLRLAGEIAYTHHEKWDGSGYPQGLKGEAIPIPGRLMALADVYDALVFARVYRGALPHDTAKGIILEGRGSHFDPRVVDAFLAIEERFIKIAREFSEDGH
jgi:HD-GYP domain-containing protein (c-di-GMP phosphodiesterase class II)